MKITERQLRRTIRRVLKEAAAGSWVEFIELASSGDYDRAGEWIKALAKDYKIEMPRDHQDSFIEMASADTDAAECQRAWNEYLQMMK